MLPNNYNPYFFHVSIHIPEVECFMLVINDTESLIICKVFLVQSEINTQILVLRPKIGLVNSNESNNKSFTRRNTFPRCNVPEINH